MIVTLLTASLFFSMPGEHNGLAGRHRLFTEILQDYVSEGLVDYRRLCEDERLEQYLQQLSATNPDTIANRDAQLAFWINAYNAFTLKIVCDNYPIDSITDLHFGGRVIGFILKKTVWDRRFITIAERKLTLNEIEHEIIRRVYEEPRIHFALVCAALSCPELRREAYEGHKLDEQFNDQARKFLGNENKNRFDLETRTAHISKVFDWFEDDFGDSEEQLLLYVSKFLPEEIARDIRAQPDAWKIEHTHYDWRLNQQADSPAEGSGRREP